jgi:hypothetical protein
VVHFDEDACAKLGRIPWVVESIDCGGAAANTGCGLKDGNVDRERGSFRMEIRVIAKVVCGR